MGFKDQIKKLADNWLMIALVIIVLVVISGGGPLQSLGTASYSKSFAMDNAAVASYAPGRAMSDSYGGGIIAPVPSSGNFAPDVLQRKVIKTGSLSIETERGQFGAVEQRMKGIVSGSGGLILNENVNTYSPDNSAKHESKSGSYTIKVRSDKYDVLASQLKGIGDVRSYNENANDVTGQYQDLNIELAAEQDRLLKYQMLYADEKTPLADRLSLTDKIFDQQRTIEYIKAAIKNTDQQVDYSTLSFSLSEKQSDFINVALVKWSQLVRTFVDSFNTLLSFIAVVLPWVVAGFIIWLIAHLVRKMF